MATVVVAVVVELRGRDIPTVCKMLPRDHNNLRLLLCSLFMTKTLSYVHHRQCGRWLLSLILVYTKY